VRRWIRFSNATMVDAIGTACRTRAISAAAVPIVPVIHRTTASTLCVPAAPSFATSAFLSTFIWCASPTRSDATEPRRRLEIRRETEFEILLRASEAFGVLRRLARHQVANLIFGQLEVTPDFDLFALSFRSPIRSCIRSSGCIVGLGLSRARLCRQPMATLAIDPLSDRSWPLTPRQPFFLSPTVSRRLAFDGYRKREHAPPTTRRAVQRTKPEICEPIVNCAVREHERITNYLWDYAGSPMP
jgi:hypothetical protein